MQVQASSRLMPTVGRIALVFLVMLASAKANARQPEVHKLRNLE